MDERIVLSVVIILAVGAILFIGSGITGFVASDTPKIDAQKDSNNVYAGMILIFTLMLFLLSVYGEYLTRENHKHN